jgi:hypothetical protein
MPAARAPWADKYLSAIKDAFSYAESIEHPEAQHIALNALQTLYGAYGEMGYFGRAFQNADRKFKSGDMVIDTNLSGVEKLLPGFQRAVYDFTRECSQRGIDPSIFFGHAEVSDYTKFCAEYLKEEGSGKGFPGMLTPSSHMDVQEKLDSENHRGLHN